MKQTNKQKPPKSNTPPKANKQNQSHYAVKGKGIKGSFGHQKCEKKQLVKLCFPRLFLSTNHVKIHQPFHHRGRAVESKFMTEHLC